MTVDHIHNIPAARQDLIGATGPTGMSWHPVVAHHGRRAEYLPHLEPVMDHAPR